MIRYSHRVSQLHFHYLGSNYTQHMVRAARHKNAKYIYSVFDLYDYPFGRDNVIYKVVEYKVSSTLFCTLIQAGYPIDVDTVEDLVHLCGPKYMTLIPSLVLLDAARRCDWDVNVHCILTVLCGVPDNLTKEDVRSILRHKADYSDDLKKRLAPIVLKVVNDGYIGLLAQELLCECGLITEVTADLLNGVLTYSVNANCLKTAQLWISRQDITQKQEHITECFVKAYSKGFKEVCEYLLGHITDKISLRSLAEYAPSTELFRSILYRLCRKSFGNLNSLYTPEECLLALSRAAKKINFFSIPVLLEIADYTKLTGKEYNLVMCIRDNDRLFRENTELRSCIAKMRGTFLLK